MAPRAQPQSGRSGREEVDREAGGAAGRFARDRRAGGDGAALSVLEPEWARAKVNLYLHVLGRRADGYHLLDSLAAFPAAADVVTAAQGDGLTLEVTGPFAAGLGGGDNLVLRAAQALQEASGRADGARLRLEKNLPVASGIGGGSADAAAALRLVDRMWGTGLPAATLAGIALGLGADVPVCLSSVPARMGGIGEVIGTAPALPPGAIALVNAMVPVSTPAVFRAREGGFSEAAVLPARWADVGAMAADLRGLRNDLEPAALRVAPVVGEVLAWLRARPGCLLARMSGSGGTCFALFAEESEASACAAAAPAAWWAWAGPLG